ncbi:tetratricopeptide repeat protein [Pigmentibacter ruber]|uniref:tetratricopeptide repeat protein n=1 Tax=Pigmentibacter ruber TaxID=2683196 RepID=UPI00131C6864|nr:tetratricopeptide repeat protein [Pigmentibacter ruber]
MPDGKSEHLRVVVIDDQLNMRKALFRIFDKTGNYEVEDFGNAKEAIAWLKTHAVDLVITDIYMSQGDGFEVLAYIRGRAMQNDIPVLFISGEATKEDIVRSVDLGVSDYILKPFEAQDIIQKAESIYAKYKNPPENIKKVRFAESLFFNEKYAEAKKEFLIINEKFKPTARSLIGLAQTEAKLGNITDALELVNQAIEINSMYYPAYAAGADILLGNKKKVEAIPFLVKELKINGKQIHRRMLLADIYIENIKTPGNFDKAIEQMKLALHDEPTDETLLLRYAEMLWNSGNKEKGVHYCLKARRQNPESTKSLMQLANFYIQDGHPIKAVNMFSDILNKSPNQYDVYLCRAKIFEKLNENEKAIADLNKIPKTIVVLRLEVLKAKGRIYAKMGKIPDAIAACEEVANMEPTADNLARVGLLFIRLKNYRSALGWYEQSTLMDPDHSKYTYNLGCCYEALKDKKKAIECYERSLKLDPNGKETIVALARIKGTPVPNSKAVSKANPPKAG